jgi:hypothetical protein
MIVVTERTGDIRHEGRSGEVVNEVRSGYIVTALGTIVSGGGGIPASAMLWDDGSAMQWDDNSYMTWD